MIQLAYRIPRILLQKGPAYVLRRLGEELFKAADRWTGPLRRRAVHRRIAKSDIFDMWARLSGASYLCTSDKNIFDDTEVADVLLRAERALHREINILGSGPVHLHDPVDWHRDFVVGKSWPCDYHRSIDYVNAGQVSDVKRVWELSRLQWAMPLGQAYFLTQDDRFAGDFARLIRDWDSANPTGYGVNWACTMEPAIRVANLITSFALCAEAPSWQDPDFQRLFVRLIYDHADFIAHHLERGDINGNHYTANAAGLVFAGLFLQSLDLDNGFVKLGQSILTEEIELQVLDDGVDFEAALSYHRLVWELFCYAALFLERRGYPIEPAYRDRLIAMAGFSRSYSMPRTGYAPLIGDNDDGRFLAMGGQDLHDHRYLVTLTATAFGLSDLNFDCGTGIQELKWLLGTTGAAHDAHRSTASTDCPCVHAFAESGFYILRHHESYVFIDSGPVGLAGRGGHGHSDLLSFDLVLAGQSLIADSGSYVYTSDFGARHEFRATAAHNTPQVDGAEIFSPVGFADLWTLDGRVNISPPRHGADETSAWFEAGHDAFAKLPDPVHIQRRLSLSGNATSFSVVDRFVTAGEHSYVSRFHLAPDVSVGFEENGRIKIKVGDIEVFGTFPHEDWQLDIKNTYISEAYGVRRSRPCLVFSRRGLARDFHLNLQVASCL